MYGFNSVIFYNIIHLLIGNDKSEMQKLRHQLGDNTSYIYMHHNIYASLYHTELKPLDVKTQHLVIKTHMSYPSLSPKPTFCLGYFLKPRVGCSDGYYCLDLTNELDRFCFTKILEFTMTFSFKRKNKR